MKNLSKILVLTATILPTLSFAAPALRCEKEVTFAVEGTNMYNVVEHVRSKDQINYVVIFRAASGDAEQASVAVVKVDPKDCSIKNVKYVHGAHASTDN